MSFSWDRVISALEQHIPSENIEEWIKPTKVHGVSENLLELVVPNDLFVDWIKENFLEHIYTALRETNQNIEKVKLLTEDDLRRKKRSAPTGKTTTERKETVRLNPKYRFDSFVVGPSNQFCHAAALAVAEAPSSSYNPLYLYGGSGLGKTHLLQAIGHSLLEDRPDLKISYTTCEDFTNQFINSIRYNRGDEFRERYRNVDVLLIDDIQFLSGKTQTQEEFFHTFNALFEQQKQIILSSDCPPSEIPKLESRLTSRFQWGLIADIQPPALETRIAILKKKSEVEQAHIKDDVILFIASKVKTNVRELEGALVKLLAYASLGKHQIDLELARQCLKSIVKEEDSNISCDKIKRFIADRYQIQSKDLSTKNNSKRIAHPRQIAMYLTRHLTNMSLPEIGQAFGNKHHSTVLYSIQKVSKRMKENDEYASLIASYKMALN